MMILSAARSMSPDVTGKYPSMVNQTNHQMKTKPQHQHGSNQSSMAIDTMKTPTVVRFQKKSCITADDNPLCYGSMSRDVSGRYTSIVNQTYQQMQTNPHHSTWLKSEYHAIDTMTTQRVVQMEKKSCITADDDPL
jgi:hypothetical protein